METIKQNKTYVVIAVLIVAIIVAWIIIANKGTKSDTASNTENPTANDQQANVDTGNTIDNVLGATSGNTSGIEPIKPATNPITGDTLTGTLLASDNLLGGNLMIASENNTKVYLVTTRDWSSLLGKKVKATISGDIHQFILLDIVATE